MQPLGVYEMRVLTCPNQHQLGVGFSSFRMGAYDAIKAMSSYEPHSSFLCSFQELRK